MKNKLNFANLIENNTVIFIFSVVCSLIIWFVMAAENVFGLPRVIYDVPVTIKLSEDAQEAGVRVFGQDINRTSVSISGNSLIINNVNSDDLEVSASLSPIVGTLTGKSLMEEELVLNATKKENSMTDYEISELEPTTVTVLYDKYKEQVFDITNELYYTSDTNFYVDKPVFSANQVTVSGPESSVKKIAKVAINRTFDNQITATTQFTSGLTFYDNNNIILDPAALYLSFDIETVDVALNVYAKQTVELLTTQLNMPVDFSQSRITIDPTAIEIAGANDIISNYKNITLTTPIDFSKINLENNTFTTEIPMPENIRNISNIETATISVNLNGYKETDLTLKKFNITNVPDGKSVEVVEKVLPVAVISTSAQASTINVDNIYATIDMAGKTDVNGEIQVPIKVGISGSDSSWIYGEYSITVKVSNKTFSSGLG